MLFYIDNKKDTLPQKFKDIEKETQSYCALRNSDKRKFALDIFVGFVSLRDWIKYDHIKC